MPGLSLLLVALLAAGCAHSPKNEKRAPGVALEPVPQAPVFLSGPMALLLTNVEGFRAQVLLESGTPPQQVVAGELMGNGAGLVFAPALSGAARKHSPAAGSAFIWDVPGNRGHILNGPLQAYAPITSNTQFTNIAAGSAVSSAAPENIAGHLCQRVEAVVTANDGSITAFRLWRAADLKGLPLRITCTSSSTPLTLTLSKARLENLPSDLFLPPSDFTKYNSAEAMVSELTTRQQNLKHRPTYQPEEGEPGAGLDSRLPTRVP